LLRAQLGAAPSAICKEDAKNIENTEIFGEGDKVAVETLDKSKGKWSARLCKTDVHVSGKDIRFDQEDAGL
jgi:hypothetical protein